MQLRHPLLVAAPGIAALVVAVVALGRAGDDDAAVTEARPSAGAPLGFRELYERVDGAVGRIDARRDEGDPPFGTGRWHATGSAYLYDDAGHMVTSAHLVDRGRRATIRFGRSSTRVRARILGFDRTSDLAVVQVDPDDVDAGVRSLDLAPAASIEVGEPVLAVGTPHHLQGSASAGIVSATGRLIRTPSGFPIPDAVQTDTPVNPGSSGGPLVDERARVVGVTTQGRAPGVSFAVSSTTIARVVPQLIRDGRARTAFLGVEVDDRARVTAVTPGGPAEDAGIRAGDVIRSVAGRETSGEGAIASAVVAQRPGERVEVRLRRRTVTVTLGKQPRR